MNKILDYARLHVGKPYKLGRSGPDLFDCSGLTMRAAQQVGFRWKHGATMQWNDGHAKGPPATHGYWLESGPIETLPLNKVAFLFNRDKARKDRLVMAHTGIYDGNGKVVQAGGQYRGVSDNPPNKSRWTNWAILNDGGKSTMPITKGSAGVSVKALQVALISLGYAMPKHGADGKWGTETDVAVRKFQADHKLPVTGVWDAESAEALSERMAVVEEPVPVPDYKAILAKLDSVIKQLRDMRDAIAQGMNQ